MLWTIVRTVHVGRYIYAVVPNHPRRTKNDYVYFHRVVMENHLGRLLLESEVVHHRDGDGHNNAVDNLQVLHRAEHARMHSAAVGRKWVDLRCPFCEKLFDRPKNRTQLNNSSKKATFCSRSCNGQFSTLIQAEGLTEALQARLDRNIVLEYRRVTQ